MMMIGDYEIDDLVDELESRGYKVADYSDSRTTPPTNLHEELCQQFDLSRHTSVDELLNHIRSLL